MAQAPNPLTEAYRAGRGKAFDSILCAAGRIDDDERLAIVLDLVRVATWLDAGELRKVFAYAYAFMQAARAFG